MNALIRYLCISLIVGAAVCLGAFSYIVHHKCIDFSILENHYYVSQPSILLDDEGNEWARFQLDRRDPIKLHEMPQHLINAFVAAEDWKFFEHAGISWKGIIRSTLINLYHGRKVQGASTITQQLVRLLYFDAKKTFERKIKEQCVALLIEFQFTKEQILETYLNNVCFGCGIYGVEAASQRFWGKQAAKISIDEAAVLAAIMRSPSRYCPLVNPLSAQKRRNIILQQMRKLDFISPYEYDRAYALPVTIKEQETSAIAPHVKETVRIFLEEVVGKNLLYTGGLTIQTTLNRGLQHKAQQAFTKQITLLRQHHHPKADGAVMTLEVATGEIKVLVGGYSFTTSKFNRALQARRQMGSTFKPLVYMAALQAGKTFADVAVDEPLEIKQHAKIWRPNNTFLAFDGPMTLAWALTTSNNIISIKTLLEVGADPIIGLAKKCHLQGPFTPYPSLALGCVDATVREVVGMFNIFANDGVYVEPHLIAWVKDRWGKKIWKRSCHQERIVDSKVNSQLVKALELSLQRVRSLAPQAWIDGATMSKTGTTNDSRTCWFTGSTPELTTSVYIGYDDNSSMGKNVFPLRTAFPIWMELNRSHMLKRKNFNYDSGLKEIYVDRYTGIEVADSQDLRAIAVLV